MPAFQFNSQGVEPQYGSSGGLPVGRHPVVITASALKPTKDNTGGYLELIMTAIDGPAKGMEQADRLNLHNKSEAAVRIANQQLAAYCHVTGVFAFNATEELHNKPFVVEIVPRKDNPNQTEIGKLFDMNGNEPGKAGSGAPTGQPASPPPPPAGQPSGGAWAGQPQQQPTGQEQPQQPPAQPGWAGQPNTGAPGGGAAPAGGGWQQGGGGQQPAWGAR